MDPLVHLLRAISPLAAGVLLASVWQAFLLTAVVALALRAIPGLSPAGRSRIWTAVLVVVLLLPLLNLLTPHDAAPAGTQLHVAGDWSVALLALWTGAAATRASALCWNAFRLLRLARRAVPVSAPENVLTLLDGPRRATLCTSNEVNRPSIAGFFRPRVLLPQGLLETLERTELEHVVLHEMEHLRRRDDWMNLLQQISLVLLPLNPALFWLDRRLCRERELACDDGVLTATQARRAYAACLVKLAEDSLLRKGFALALSALGTRARESDLVNRVRRILAGPQSVLPARSVRPATVALSVAGLALTGLLAGSPQFVSFDPAAPALMAQSADPFQANVPTLSGKLMEASAQVRGTRARPVLTSAILTQANAPRTLKATTSRRRVTRRAGTQGKAIVPSIMPWGVRSVSTSAFARSASMMPVRNVSEDVAQPRSTAGHSALPAARIVVTGFEFSQSVYAAVPVRGGWLILQL